MFPTYGNGIQQGYWDGNQFVFPNAQQASQPTAIPVPQQSLLPQAQPLTREPDRQGGLLSGGGGGEVSGPTTGDTGPLGIGDVSGGIVGNLGKLGSVAGLATGVPGLGMLGAGISNAAKADAYGNDLSGLKGFDPSALSGFVNDMSFGALGQSVHGQARDAVRGHNAQNAGDTTAFGGKMSGRMSAQAKNQGRGGASPSEGKTAAINDKEGFGESAGGGDKIICTQMNQTYGFGSFRNAVWMRHAVGLPPEYQKGYHAIFRPILRWAYNDKPRMPQRVTQSILEWGVRRRTADIWKQRHGKRNVAGAMVRAVFDNLCYIVGRFL